MADFADSPTALVADVDCTAGGQDLCSKHGVEGYPTIKYGDPNNLEKYEGGRSYDELKAFADENLGPSCGPGNVDLCSDEKKALIAKFSAMSEGKRDAKIRKAEKQIKEIEEKFEEFQTKLQKRYEEENTKKDAALEAIKTSGLGLLKAVHAHEKNAAKSEL
eukprot:TRINITY_DN489_c0_g1_i1.p1 TRINITY_DN489_c0_g1~~TRINITY_DN489_c0_g1_i1.p1  ORF type:complete len:162 (-),score=58.59 TRINITY_DN489_c0_g1_i1:244-729(-)